MSSDPLGFDPLAPAAASPTESKPALSSSNSWAKHSFDAQPFASDAWAEVTSSGLGSTKDREAEPVEQSTDHSSLAPIDTQWDDRVLSGEAPAEASATAAAQEVEPHRPPEETIASPVESEENFVYQENSTSSPIAMAQSASASHERTSSNSDAPDSSPSSLPTHYGVSVTPTSGGHLSNYAKFNSINDLDSSVEGAPAHSFGATPSSAGSSHFNRGPSTLRQSLETEDTSTSAAEPIADLKALRRLIVEASTGGDLFALQALLSGARSRLTDSSEYPSQFVLANSASPTTGLTPLHYAAGRGHVDLCRWLVNDAGALPELEDGEGETPLHKAAHRGHLDVVRFFVVEAQVDVAAADNDGWTALHNAASRGWLDIVRTLIDACAPIDSQSKHGYTALMNAASKGQLPIVNFLIKAGAAPLLRNAYGESAFDLAAGVFELLICSVLATYEVSVWAALAADEPVPTAYNPFKLHQTVPVVVYENQRLAQPTLKKLSTLSTLGGQAPRFSSKALSRNDGRTAFTFAASTVEGSQKELPIRKDEVGLPIVGAEAELVLPKRREVRSGGIIGSSETAEGKRAQLNPPSRRGSAISALSPPMSPLSTSPPHSVGEPAWFWLSDWTIDLTAQNSNYHDGWSYATSFDAPQAEWSSEPPAELRRLLTGGAQAWGGQKWVRRKRWVRLMRRRLDLPDFGFADLHVSSLAGAPSNQVLAATADEEAAAVEEAEAAPKVGADYLARARFLAGKTAASTSDRASIRSGKTVVRANEDAELDPVELRKAYARLDRAADELRAGITSDEDSSRRRRAEDELESYIHQMALIKTELGPDEDDDEDDDDEFIYSGQDADPDEDARSVWTSAVTPGKPPSEVSSSGNRSGRSASGASNASFNLASISTVHSPVQGTSALPDLTPQLSQAPEFRVPTNDSRAPSSSSRARKVGQDPRQSPTFSLQRRTRPPWEADSAVSQCRSCSRNFSFFQRKHHCRRCGLIFCHHCSSHVDVLDPSAVVREPGSYPQEWDMLNPLHRTCDSCHAALALGGSTSQPFNSTSVLSPGAFFPGSPSLGSSTASSDAGGSEASTLEDCPVCGTVLGTLGGRTAQEEHVKDCLETGGGTIVQNGRYLVFKLPAGPLVGEECRICFEELEVGDKIGRLSCLCYFHKQCIAAWLDRGNSCPFHAARDVVG